MPDIKKLLEASVNLGVYDTLGELYSTLYTESLLAEKTNFDFLKSSKDGFEELKKNMEIWQKEYGVNGLYLMGLACLESGYGKSEFARKRNNLVGWNAINSNANKASYFESKEECILYVAERLKTNYLNENGCYFNGYSARAIDVKYCTDKKHADKIIQIINELKVRL